MKKNYLISFLSVLVLAAFAAVLIIPSSREVFKSLSAEHPYIMGFIKFALMATVGEILAARIAKKQWIVPTYVGLRMLIWGLIGIAITFMMKIFSGGVAALMSDGLLPGGTDKTMLVRFLKAFYTSAVMNLTFGPTFMAFHKCSDKWLELKASGKPHKALDAVSAVDFKGFVGFTLFKTIPIFWIPAHTITFMLPGEYQVIMAAALSVALGIILSLKK